VGDGSFNDTVSTGGDNGTVQNLARTAGARAISWDFDGDGTSGSQVSSGNHNWTCANANCTNCASNASCAPGATGCPCGAVWTDNGVCQ
jgi:hypothetical protein